VLEQSEITDDVHFIAEDQLWAFLNATQADTLKKLEDDYGTDAREEVFKAHHTDKVRRSSWRIACAGATSLPASTARSVTAILGTESTRGIVTHSRCRTNGPRPSWARFTTSSPPFLSGGCSPLTG
jgi:hypothetical protein